MRKALFVIGLLAATGLTGCDRWNDLWNKPAPQPVAVTCQCAPPIRGTVAPAAAQSETGHAAHRHYAHGYRWHDSYAERSADIYGYSSDSRSSYGSGEAYGEGGYGEAEHGDSRGNARAWEDGYGGRHLYDAGEAEFYATQSHLRIAETPARLDPWHGYGDDWDY